MASGNGPEAPAALVRLIEVQIAAGKPVGASLRDSAAALAVTLRGAPMGHELSRAHLRALIHSDLLESALTELPRAALPPEMAQAIADELISKVASAEPAERFLTLALAAPLPYGDGPGAGDLRRRVATRLIRLGLTGPARELLIGEGGVPPVADRLLIAQAYLADRRPDLVLGYLADLDSTEAMALKARAHGQAEEFTRAAAAYDLVGDAPRQARALWHAREWLAAAPGLPAIYADAAALSGATPPLTGQTEDRVLADTRAILDDSRDARAMMEALLSAPPIPDE